MLHSGAQRVTQIPLDLIAALGGGWWNSHNSGEGDY
jgi:hypothetical protein